jgi:hypothetical protein
MGGSLWIYGDVDELLQGSEKTVLYFICLGATFL